jgi:hypothetical protein
VSSFPLEYPREQRSRESLILFVTCHRPRRISGFSPALTRLVYVDTRRCPFFFLEHGRRLFQALILQNHKFGIPEVTLKRFRQTPCYSEAQLAQRQETRLRLSDLHRTTERELQYVSNSYLTMPQYAAAGETLTTLATRIKSLVQRRAQIRLVALSENSVTPTVVIGTVCAHCYGVDEDFSTEAVESENPDAEVIIAIDRLLELVQQTEERVAGRCRSLPPLNSLMEWPR